MLLILIPIGWLALLTFFVILCQIAARADATQARVATPHNGAPGLRRGLTHSELPAAIIRSAGGADDSREVVVGVSAPRASPRRCVQGRRPSRI
jgi:hypothetical protein